jgi:hypothetical protein
MRSKKTGENWQPLMPAFSNQDGAPPSAPFTRTSPASAVVGLFGRESAVLHRALDVTLIYTLLGGLPA